MTSPLSEYVRPLPTSTCCAIESKPTTAPVADAKEHVLAVRVYDRYENVVAVKAVVR